MSRPTRILLFSTLYPSAVRPIHGIFVETRLRELIKTGQIEAKVIAPVPWFPWAGERFGEYGLFAATPRFEARNGLDVYHPRYVLPPKVGMNVAPHTLAAAALPHARALIQKGFDFDLIDAHYYYPDGVAAGIMARKLGKPFVVTARGTDLNLIPQYSYPRKLILETAAAASGSIGVCQALVDSLSDLGADPAKLHTLRNGVDLQRFVPEARADARQRLGLPVDAKLLLSVGHLIERKGHHLAIAALPLLPPDVQLLIAGGGPERAALQQLANTLGVTNRVRFAGVVPQTELKDWYSAADALALCSSREGWANVLLESMACGTPVIATNIWGTPEVVSTAAAGVLMPERSAQGLAQAWATLFSQYPSRAATRAHAETFSWEATTQGQLSLFRQVIESARAGQIPPP
ncbi:glycosyltransferase family 4 protein [Rhodoferax antarcticus]|uniref:glycosyltransferase family 4 protein n=1 Tax=Rhodoferax antarcticus TaxID=81479 RepID=UPI0022254050|nr:glycosyltransferase family 4 protein [Rhodoferax antarcticus]MCW2313672.1 glycosyltransferase involved in cell wall biosynthesis [Rhodoferax antarcticus]